MLACLDVQYLGTTAYAACVVFEKNDSQEPVEEIVSETTGVENYVPGEFFRRELPCLLDALKQVSVPISHLFIDGFVWLSKNRPGLGVHLYEALAEKSIAIIGVAKSDFKDGSIATPVSRGESARPLYVTAIGIEQEAAAQLVSDLHGEHRIPKLIKLADTLARAAAKDANQTTP